MKKLEIFFLIMIIVLTVLVIDLIYQNAQPKRVYFEETTPNLLGENDQENVCTVLCEEKGYDGVRGAGRSSSTYICNCYKLVK